MGWCLKVKSCGECVWYASGEGEIKRENQRKGKIAKSKWFGIQFTFNRNSNVFLIGFH